MLWAGIAAGVVSTVAQMVLTWVFTDTVSWALYRDARMTAAIVMGRHVLPPPATFDIGVMLIATGIHFTLSVAYSWMLAHLLLRFARRSAWLTGALFGLAIYGINFYGFTLLFPWFAELRNWISVLTHIVFGVAAAGAYLAADRDRFG